MTTMLGRSHTQDAKSLVVDFLGASVLSEDQITDSGDTECCISVGALRIFYRPIIGAKLKVWNHMGEIIETLYLRNICLFEIHRLQKITGVSFFNLHQQREHAACTKRDAALLV
jgi:hypothetical protein